MQEGACKLGGDLRGTNVLGEDCELAHPEGIGGAVPRQFLAFGLVPFGQEEGVG
jgi:hypothetical protein